jgi:hypothetical protein
MSARENCHRYAGKKRRMAHVQTNIHAFTGTQTTPQTARCLLSVCVCHLFALMVHIWSVFLGLKRQCPVNSQPELALSLPLACVLTAYLIHTADRASARTCPSPVGGGWVCGTGRGFGMGATRPHFLGSESLAHSVRYWKVISSEGNVVGPLSWRVRLIQSTLTD